MLLRCAGSDTSSNAATGATGSVRSTPGFTPDLTAIAHGATPLTRTRADFPTTTNEVARNKAGGAAQTGDAQTLSHAGAGSERALAAAGTGTGRPSISSPGSAGVVFHHRRAEAVGNSRSSSFIDEAGLARATVIAGDSTTPKSTTPLLPSRIPQANLNVTGSPEVAPATAGVSDASCGGHLAQLQVRADSAAPPGIQVAWLGPVQRASASSDTERQCLVAGAAVGTPLPPSSCSIGSASGMGHQHQWPIDAAEAATWFLESTDGTGDVDSESDYFVGDVV